MSNNEKSCVGRIWCVVQIFIHVMDLVTDCSTLAVYWQEQSKTVFTLALLSVVVSLPIGIASYIYQFRLCRGRAQAEYSIVTLKLIDILLESIPQLTINLYILSYCEDTLRTIQYISGGFSFLGMCVGILHFDVTIKVHAGIGLLQKAFILLYRSSYLAARMLAFVYFTYTLSWWAAAVVVTHWIIGLLCIMRNSVEPLARSIAFVFLNTFIYVGDFSGVKALFILVLYVLENLIMIASAFIVSSQVSPSTSPATFLGTTPVQISDSLSGSFNAFAPYPVSPNQLDYTESYSDSFYVKEFCLHSNIIPIHVGLNVLAVVACCFYNVSFHYNDCAEDGNRNATNKVEEDLELKPSYGENELDQWVDMS